MIATQSNRAPLRCSVCGTNAACNCGAEYISAGDYARMVLARNPEKSSRALAAEAGVDHDTVDRIRQSVGGNPPPDAKVVGIDGKSYPASHRRGPSIPKYPNTPYPEQPEVKRFMRALLQLSWAQKLYLWDEVLPKYHPRGVQD